MCSRGLAFAGMIAIPSFGALGAQVSLIPPRRVAVTAGANWATFAGEDASPWATSRRGFIGGAQFILPVSRRFAIQPEFLYSVKGSEGKQTVHLPFQAAGDSAHVSASITLSYLEIPILARFEFPVSNYFVPFIYAGPAISFLHTCRRAGQVDADGGEGPCDRSVKFNGGVLQPYPPTYKVDGSAIGGIGLAMRSRSGTALTIAARYSLGFGYTTDSTATKNRVMSILAGVELPLRK